MPELSSKVLIELLSQYDEKGMKAAEGGVENFGSKFAKAGLVIGAAVLAMSGAVIAFGMDAFDAFSKNQDALERLQTGINNVRSATDKSIEGLVAYDDELERTTRFSATQIETGQGMLTTFQLNQKTIKELTPGMLDMAEAFRKSTGETLDLQQIAVLFGKSMGDSKDNIDGMVNTLHRMGVIMTDSQKLVFKFGTEQERAATLAQIMDMNFKGFAEGGGKTASGQIQIMQQEIEHMKIGAGALVAEAIVPMVAWVTGSLIPSLTNLGTWIMKNKTFFEQIGATIMAIIMPVVKQVTQLWKEHHNTIVMFVEVAGAMLAFFLIGLVAIIAAVIAIVVEIVRELSVFAETVNKDVQASLAWLSDTLTKISLGWDIFKKAVSDAASAILKAVKDMVNGAIDALNVLIRGFDAVSGKVPGIKISIPQIPHLAAGTSNFAGGMALVGESGPEKVILPAGSQVIPNNKIGQGNGMQVVMNQTIYTQVDFDNSLKRMAWQLGLT